MLLSILLSPMPERTCSKNVIKLLENECRVGLVGSSYSLFEYKHVHKDDLNCSSVQETKFY